MIKEIFQNASIKKRITKNLNNVNVVESLKSILSELPFYTLTYDNGFSFEYYSYTIPAKRYTSKDICIFIVKYNNNIYFNYITKDLSYDNYSLYTFLRKNLE